MACSSWNDCNTQGKLETKVIQGLGWGGGGEGVNKVYYKQCEYAVEKILILILAKGGNFISPMMHRFILYYQSSERT